MALTRGTVLTTGGALALSGLAGCQSVLPSTGRSLAYIVVNNKTSTTQTITLAAYTDETSSNWKNTFSLGAGKTRKAAQEGPTPMSHDIIGNATYRLEVIVKNGPNAFWRWHDADGSMMIDVCEDLIKHQVDKNR